MAMEKNGHVFARSEPYSGSLFRLVKNKYATTILMMIVHILDHPDAR